MHPLVQEVLVNYFFWKNLCIHSEIIVVVISPTIISECMHRYSEIFVGDQLSIPLKQEFVESINLTQTERKVFLNDLWYQ